MIGHASQSQADSIPVNRWRRLATSLLLALAVALPPLLLIPIQVHAANPYDFSAGMADLLLPLSALAGIAAAIVFAVLLLVPTEIYRLVVSASAGLALVFWAQGQLMVWDYGVLDGSAIEWGAYPWRSVADSAIWLLVLSGAILARGWLAPRAGLVAAVLLLIQAVPTAQAWYSVPAQPDFHRYNLDDSHKFSFSSEQNVVVIVLDAFQSDVFHRIIDDEPRWRDELDGFTYFRNALAGYSKTYPSLALMLTGQWYDNDEPIQQFVRRSFLDGSLPRQLMQQGWRVDLFPHIKRVVHVSPRVASNAVPAIACSVLNREAGILADLGLFRVSPHWAKRYWLNEYRWRWARLLPERCDADDSGTEATQVERHIHAALHFVSELQSDADANLEAPAFKLYHLLIPHAPFQIDESLAMTRLPGGREGFFRQSVASMEVVRRILNQLRQHSIYDQSTVVIVSDHGGGEYTDQVDTGVLGDQAGQAAVDNDEIPASHLASGLALVLIKPPGARGELTISDAPVSLGDVARTVADLIGLTHVFPGENMFKLSAGAERERRYRFYQFTGWSGEYLPEMTEYAVAGFSWFAGNWQATGRVLESAAQTVRSHSWEFRLGQTIRFRPDSAHLSMLGTGWSEPHADGLVWSNTDHAELEIPLNEPVAGPLVVHFDLLPFTARGAIPASTIEVVVNGSLHQVWTSERRGWHELRIPETIARESDTLHFRFHFPDAASPFDHGLSGDQRTLGIALYRLKVEHAFNEADR